MTGKARSLALILGAAVVVALLLLLQPAEAFDKKLFLTDYTRLKKHLSGAYANLEWIAGHRNLDLKALDARTVASINAASSAGEGRDAIAAFVRAFQDPHFYAKDLEPSFWRRLVSSFSSSDPREPTSDLSARRACSALGYSGRDLGFDLKFESQRGYEAAPSSDGNPFYAGVLQLGSGRRLGLLRIAHFGEDGYPEVCREVWSEVSNRIEEMCEDGWCGEFHMMVRNRLLAYLEARIGQLRKLGYDTLVVDITANGGGTDWVHAAAEIVSPVKLTCPRSSFVKHPHWTRILSSMIADTESELQREHLPDRTRRMIEAARTGLHDLRRQTEEPCDRSALWENPKADLGCTNIVDGMSYTCGLFPSLDPADLEGAMYPGLFYKAFQNRFRPHVNDQPLVVLIDGGTASASELFGSVLQGSGAALLMGSRSYGAGCGFVNGGIPLTLEHAGLKVMAPDCVRFRADGINEIEGLQPDIELEWTPEDSATKRTELVLAALQPLTAAPTKDPTPKSSAPRLQTRM